MFCVGLPNQRMKLLFSLDSVIWVPNCDVFRAELHQMSDDELIDEDVQMNCSLQEQRKGWNLYEACYASWYCCSVL